MDMKLEVVVIPVSDVDRARDFYARLGWRIDADVAADQFRLVQMTPPGSSCSVQFGTGLIAASPGTTQALYLVVDDIDATREELQGIGVDVSPVFHCATGFACRFEGADADRRVAGPAPEHGSYGSFASFNDPDGNGWLLQEITTRLPGR
jgi:catechol 2,3-dioxygenase-like lactoylglutathione lyase family enzyme